MLPSVLSDIMLTYPRGLLNAITSLPVAGVWVAESALTFVPSNSTRKPEATSLTPAGTGRITNSLTHTVLTTRPRT